MAKGEIAINDAWCKGCAFCVHFCPQKCLEITGEKINAGGNLVPTLTDPEKCNGCGICGWMCPDLAINVYKYVESSS